MSLPASIVEHVDGCTCVRCDGLEACHVCGRVMLDMDWCFACRRLVLSAAVSAPRRIGATHRNGAMTSPPYRYSCRLRLTG